MGQLFGNSIFIVVGNQTINCLSLNFGMFRVVLNSSSPPKTRLAIDIR